MEESGDTFESSKQVAIEWMDDMIAFWKETRDRLEALYTRGQSATVRLGKHFPVTPPNVDFVGADAEMTASMKQVSDFMQEMRDRLVAAQTPLEFLKALDLRKEVKVMRFPTELAQKAREIEPDFPMGLPECEVWLKNHATCEGCQYYEKCQYFGLGVLVAIGRTEEILNELKGGK